MGDVQNISKSKYLPKMKIVPTTIAMPDTSYFVTKTLNSLFYQLHAASRTHQYFSRRVYSCRIKALHSPIPCEFSRHCVLCGGTQRRSLASAPQQRNGNIKSFISCSGNRTYNLSRLQSQKGNAYTSSLLASLQSFKQSLFQELNKLTSKPVLFNVYDIVNKRKPINNVIFSSRHFSHHFYSTTDGVLKKMTIVIQ